MLWLSVAPNPKHPVYEVADVYISPVFQNAGNSASAVTTIILRLEIANHNRVIGIVYDETYLAFYNADMGIGFGAGTLSGFYQGRENSTTREVRVDVDQQLYLCIVVSPSCRLVDLSRTLHLPISASEKPHLHCG